MLSQPDKSTFRVAPRDFDRLTPLGGIEAYPAKACEIPELASMARDRVPGVQLSAADLGIYCRLNSHTVFSFARNGQLLGGIAFLFLNDDGLDALILDKINLRLPQPGLLARPDDQPAAIYWWALVAKGRGVGGLGHVARLFASPQYRHADFYTQPSSRDGVHIITALGFERMPSWQADLWTYRRAANREAARSEDHLRHAA